MPLITYHVYSCSAERRKDRICSVTQYNRVFDRLNNIPQGVDHLVVQLGIPIAYPRMVFLESALDSKFNPLLLLGRNGSLGLSGFVNKFNAEAELLDDLVSFFATPLPPSLIFLRPRMTTGLPGNTRWDIPLCDFGIECNHPVHRKNVTGSWSNCRTLLA